MAKEICLALLDCMPPRPVIVVVKVAPLSAETLVDRLRGLGVRQMEVAQKARHAPDDRKCVTAAATHASFRHFIVLVEVLDLERRATNRTGKPRRKKALTFNAVTLSPWGLFGTSVPRNTWSNTAASRSARWRYSNRATTSARVAFAGAPDWNAPICASRAWRPSVDVIWPDYGVARLTEQLSDVAVRHRAENRCARGEVLVGLPGNDRRAHAGGNCAWVGKVGRPLASAPPIRRVSER